MKKKKLLLIESYIYAKTLFLFSSKVNTESLDCENKLNIDNIKIKAQILLDICEKKITALKLNNISFLILKQELELANAITDNSLILKKINNLKNNYDYHFENVSRISS